MPLPSNYPGGAQQGPTCFQKVKMGFMMGLAVGTAAGVIFGGVSAFASGLRGRIAFQQVGKAVGTMAGSFGTFMAVAQGIRC